MPEGERNEHEATEATQRLQSQGRCLSPREEVGGGVYKNEMAAALDLFTKLPCPETAINLVAACPESLSLLTAANNTFVRMTPKEYRGPKLQGYEEWMESFDSNLQRQAPFRRSCYGKPVAIVSE